MAQAYRPQGEPVFKLTLLFRDKLLQVHHLSEGETLIGRDPDCGIHIDSLAVAPQHARLSTQGAELTLRDISEGAGLLVNHKKVVEQILQDGDQIQIGKHTLRVAVDDLALPPPTPLIIETPVPIAPSRIGWLQILNGAHLGRAFPIERDHHRIGKPGTPSALITVVEQQYQIAALEGADCQVDSQPLDAIARPLNDGAIIECGELRLQFFMDQAVSLPAAAKAAAPAVSQRHFSRIAFDAQVYLRNDTLVWQSLLIDVSLKGALITRPADWQGHIGEVYTLEMVLGDDQLIIRMLVSVAHVHDERIGLQCVNIDIDSITHLRRLIELNLGEPESLERELAALGEPALPL